MEYVSPEEARALPGLRLALTAGFPAPYSMSARAVLDHHRVDYVPVLQQGGGHNPELVEWTRHRNAPVAVYNDEAPRIGWLEILNLAERLGRGESLVPEPIDLRMQMIGLINELIGENGLIWNMRIIMLGLAGPDAAAAAATKNPMYADYGYSEAAKEKALARSRSVMDAFTAHALSQDGHYLIGDRFSALDIYWAYFSQLVKTLPPDLCPMPDGLRKSYDASGAALGECDPALIEQRDWIFEHHLELPMTF